MIVEGKVDTISFQNIWLSILWNIHTSFFVCFTSFVVIIWTLALAQVDLGSFLSYFETW